MRTFLEPSRRSLMAAEQRALRMRIASTRVWNVRLRRRLVVAAAAVTISLWVATLFASDSHWAVVTVVWLVLGTGLGFW